jgi:hypothetical protein
MIVLPIGDHQWARRHILNQQLAAMRSRYLRRLRWLRSSGCWPATRPMKRSPQPNLMLPSSPITLNRRILVKPKSEPLLTLQDLAARWQVSLKSVRRIVARRELKVHRIGAQIRVSPEDATTYEKFHRS